MKKHFLSKLISSKKEADETEGLAFVVTDADSENEASKLLLRYKIAPPSFHALEKAYIFGDGLRRKLDKNEIRVVKKNITKEEAYHYNVDIYKRLREQRDAIVGIIENMLQPLIKDVVGVKVKNSELEKRIKALEDQRDDRGRRIDEYQTLMSKFYGDIPQDVNPINKKKEWKLPLKDAALRIIEIYKDDEKVKNRKYYQLRQASDEFYDQHEFVYRHGINKDALYKNVMQYWKDLK